MVSVHSSKTLRQQCSREEYMLLLQIIQPPFAVAMLGKLPVPLAPQRAYTSGLFGRLHSHDQNHRDTLIYNAK